MLNNIAIAGFKSFGSKVLVPLGQLNALIGANGSGKSNFLAAFSFIQAFSFDQITKYVAEQGGANKILHYGSRSTKSLSINVTFEEGGHYSFQFHPTVDDSLRIGKDYTVAYVGTFERDSKLEWKDIIYRLQAWRLYHFHDTSFHSLMKKKSMLHDNRFLRQDGSNIASFLYLLREKHEESYRMIRNMVRQVAPFFDDFVLEPAALNPDTILLEWRHKNSDAYFDASSLSDGTLRFMALATLLLQPTELRPEIVLLDEPELGLHPYAIAVLAAMMRSASHETQIVAATQSPTLLDHFEAEDVLVAERVRGETRLSRLKAEPLREWLEDYSLGQLWEKNHFGGRPAREGADTG